MTIQLRVDTPIEENGYRRVLDQNRGNAPPDLLADWALIITANRGPVTFEETEAGDFRSQRGGGGLVTALLGLCEVATHASWIACARSEGDAAWQQASTSLIDDLTQTQLQFLSPDEAAYEGYYNVIANPLLWFLQHSMWDTPRSPVINRATWDAWENGYVTVNQMFAEAIADQVRREPRKTLIMLQDYHLYLTPRLVRTLLHDTQQPALLHFIHIPWPGPEYWRILPPVMREAILDGLCAVDVLGFQTADDGLNFLRTCESHLPTACINLERGEVRYKDHTTYVRDFPISINVESLKTMAATAEVAECRADLQYRIKGRQLIARVDRIEPSKNIVRGFQAFEEMLALHPEHREQVSFFALLVPSRLGVEEYQRYLEDIMVAAGRINATYGTGDWEPIRVMVGENYPRAIAALQLYDVLLVNSITDGMNLVAKEGPIANQRDGVLVLSEGTGARQQLAPGALMISPFDIYATAEAMHQALVMPASERHERAERLRGIVELEDITHWLCKQLDVVAEIYQREEGDE